MSEWRYTRRRLDQNLCLLKWLKMIMISHYSKNHRFLIYRLLLPKEQESITFYRWLRVMNVGDWHCVAFEYSTLAQNIYYYMKNMATIVPRCDSKEHENIYLLFWKKKVVSARPLFSGCSLRNLPFHTHAAHNRTIFLLKSHLTTWHYLMYNSPSSYQCQCFDYLLPWAISKNIISSSNLHTCSIRLAVYYTTIRTRPPSNHCKTPFLP